MSNVESPQHYTQGFFETIYEIRDVLGHEGFKAFCMGNYIKYNARAQHKGLRSEDLAKADQYLDWAVNGLPAPVDGRVPRQADPYAAMAEAVQERTFREGEERRVEAVEELGAGYGEERPPEATGYEVAQMVADALPDWVKAEPYSLKVIKQICKTHGCSRFIVRFYRANTLIHELRIDKSNPEAKDFRFAGVDITLSALSDGRF